MPRVAEFQVFYLDNVTLGGSCEDLIHDVKVMRDAAALGLSLNDMKCEIVCNDNLSCDTLLVALSDAQLVKVSQAQLLGSPVGDDECVATVVMDKVEVLRRLGERLHSLTAHDALICCAIVLPCQSCQDCSLFQIGHTMMIAFVRF